MDTREDESPLFQDREKEEFILFAVDMLCILGAGVGILRGIEYSDSLPNALWIALATEFLLVGFAFDRGALSAHLPSIVRERVWWVGPSLYTWLLLMIMLIEGSLFEWTLVDFGLLVATAFGFWMLGAGLKRLVVRGKFEQAYREMVAKTGERRFRLNRGLLIVTVGFIAFIDLLAFIFDYEYLPRVLSASLFFLIFTNVCLSDTSENPKAQSTRITKSDE